MFNNKSISTQMLWATLLFVALFLFLGALAVQGNRMTQSILKEFFSDFSHSISKLASIEELYETGVHAPVQAVLMQTMQPSSAIDQVEQSIDAAQVSLKEYLEVERSLAGERHLLNQAFENAVSEVNLSWFKLKDLLQAKEPDQAEQQAYVLKKFYPSLDVLHRSYLKLNAHWMNQLSSQHIAIHKGLQEQMQVLWILIMFGIVLAGFLYLILSRRIQQAIHHSTREIAEIQNKKTDFTMRMTSVGNLETQSIVESVNHWMDDLLLFMRRIKGNAFSVWNFMPPLNLGVEDLTEKVVDFSRFTTDVGKTANEISLTSKELVKLMADVSTTATDTAQLATAGQTELVHLEATMKQMEEASRKISKRLAIISEKAANITSVVTTINKFADQTNLLSLNASIEAEKAGEYGLGFSVVAKEIRRLADQVALATYDIEQMVKEMKSAVSSGVMEMDQFSDEVSNDVRDVRMIGSQFVQIIGQVQTLLPYFDSVQSRVQAQSSGAQHISDSIVNLSDAVEKTSTLLANTSSKMQHMQEAAEKLHSEMQSCVVD